MSSSASGKFPLVGTRTEGLPFVSLKKIAGIALVTLVLGGTLYYFIKPDYDFEIIKKDQKVALYGNFYDHGIELELVYVPRTCGDVKYKPRPDGSLLLVDSRHPCNVKIYVDGREIYSPRLSDSGDKGSTRKPVLHSRCCFDKEDVFGTEKCQYCRCIL
ncbi:hypothetical protein [Thermococcus sp. JCM 11816]|uniref:hypothetical protein n=1 Tax=Thermococcus sp. (strain JCM 11816 / KS-1) TaxID=1295125 RepID=UPI000B13F616